MSYDGTNKQEYRFDLSSESANLQCEIYQNAIKKHLATIEQLKSDLEETQQALAVEVGENEQLKAVLEQAGEALSKTVEEVVCEGMIIDEDLFNTVNKALQDIEQIGGGEK